MRNRLLSPTLIRFWPRPSSGRALLRSRTRLGRSVREPRCGSPRAVAAPWACPFPGSPISRSPTNRCRTSCVREFSPKLANGGNGDVEDAFPVADLLAHAVHAFAGLSHFLGVADAGHGPAERLATPHPLRRECRRWFLSRSSGRSLGLSIRRSCVPWKFSRGTANAQSPPSGPPAEAWNRTPPDGRPGSAAATARRDNWCQFIFLDSKSINDLFPASTGLGRGRRRRPRQIVQRSRGMRSTSAR